MDDNTVFSPPSEGNKTNVPPQQTADNNRLSLNDLYGPSSNEPEGIQDQRVPESQNQDTSNTPTNQNVTPTNVEIEEVYTQDLPPPGVPFWKNKKVLTIVGIISMFLCLILIISFISSRGQSGISAGNATLTYWGLWEDSKTMQSIINDFQKKYPSVKVTYEKVDSKKYKERLVTRAENGTGPDIVTFHNSWTPTLTKLLLPLSTDVIAPEEFKKVYFPVVQKDLMVNGAIYGLPQGIDTLALFINKEIFDAAGLQIPQTWDDFIKAAKTLTVIDETQKIKTAGAAIGTVDNVAHFSDIASLLFLQEGIDMTKFTTYPNNIGNALTFYTSFATSNDHVWDDSLNPSKLAFAQGEVAIMFGYSWDIFEIKAANPSLIFEVYPVPNLPGRKATIASYWVSGISNKSKHQKEALLFMNFLAQKDVQQKLYTESAKTRLFGTPYARTDLAKTLESNELIYPFLQQAEYAQGSFFASDTRDNTYSERLNAYLGNAIRSMLSGSSSDTAVNTMLEGIKQVQSQSSTQ